MKNWSALFIRQGFIVREVEDNFFDCKQESEGNIEFLLKSLSEGNVTFHYTSPFLTIESDVLPEKQWLELVDFQGRGRGEGLWFRGGLEEPKLYELDTFISGVIRQLNRLGLYTNGCCDGHDRRPASILFLKEENAAIAANLMMAAGLKHVRTHGKNMRLLINNREQLLDVAEVLNLIKKEWLSEDLELIQKQFFYSTLEKLLSIDGKSGKEQNIRQFVLEQLIGYVDHVTVDESGNILAQKTYRSGNGPTILLNAHLDTVESFPAGRIIEKDGTIWSSSNGILGADDRAGVAVVLEMAKRLQASSFNGKVKFIFTVEEEIGLVGARSLNYYFLWDVDAAIVVDRRGTGDIVVSCGSYIPFCHESYGKYFEMVAKEQGLNGWKTTAGGSSDTRIWAENGIQSVNLSVGYMNEHTDDETLDVEACYNTLKLLTGVFHQERELQRVLRGIQRERVRRVI